MDRTPSPLRAITRISIASSWVNIDGTAKPVILSQVGHYYFGAVDQYYFGGNSPQLVEGLERVKNSFNSYPLSSLSVAAALASLGDTAHFATTISRIASLRQTVTAGLQGQAMTVLP